MPPGRKVPTFRRACCLRLHRTKVRNVGVRVGPQQKAKAMIPLLPLNIILVSLPLTICSRPSLILKMEAEGSPKRRYVYTRSHGVKFGILLYSRKYRNKLFICYAYDIHFISSAQKIFLPAANKQANYADLRTSKHQRISDAELHRGQCNAVDCKLALLTLRRS
jgi:hypothetical protein